MVPAPGGTRGKGEPLVRARPGSASPAARKAWGGQGRAEPAVTGPRSASAASFYACPLFRLLNCFRSLGKETVIFFPPPI